MKIKLILIMMIGILTAKTLNTPTLSKYIQTFEPLTETIVAYEVEKTDVYIQHINKNTNEIIEEDILNDVELYSEIVSIEYKKEITGYEYDSVENETVKISETNNIVKIYYNPIKTEEIQFNDIQGHWAEASIQAFVDKGYINGYEDSSFKPESSITRAEFVKVVNKIFGYTQEGIEEFTDVDKDDWFYKDICIAVKEGYIKGRTEQLFAPNDKITRQEAAMILTNIMNNKDENLDKLNTFKDGNKTSNWAMSSMEGAIESGYIKGYDDKTIRPNKEMTRAEAISMLTRVEK